VLTAEARDFGGIVLSLLMLLLLLVMMSLRIGRGGDGRSGGRAEDVGEAIYRFVAVVLGAVVGQREVLGVVGGGGGRDEGERKISFCSFFASCEGKGEVAEHFFFASDLFCSSSVLLLLLLLLFFLFFSLISIIFDLGAGGIGNLFLAFVFFHCGISLMRGGSDKRDSFSFLLVLRR
jgi:hypothetical protein